MIIYNETFIVDESIADEWLHWILTQHIASVMEIGSFNSYQILTVLDSPNEGVTYCIQYTTDAIERYSEFYYKHLTALHERHNQRFENQFVLFHTLMETID